MGLEIDASRSKNHQKKPNRAPKSQLWQPCLKSFIMDMLIIDTPGSHCQDSTQTIIDTLDDILLPKGCQVEACSLVTLESFFFSFSIFHANCCQHVINLSV